LILVKHSAPRTCILCVRLCVVTVHLRISTLGPLLNG
jgi:hypothetical protein